MQHAWLAYGTVPLHSVLCQAHRFAAERDAMGDDEYRPISRKGTNLTSAGGIGYTVVDSIDTMQIMGLDEEYKRARAWVANSLSFDRNGHFNTFEARPLSCPPLITLTHTCR